MKKLLLFLFIGLANILLAQNKGSEADINNISLSVIMPDNSEGLSSKTQSKIASKIQRIVTKYGISGEGYTNDFLIYPKFEIFNESVVEGMRNIVVVEVEFSLYIQQYRTHKVFSSYSKSLKGTGFTRQKAIVNAISKISVNDKKLKTFIEQGKQKILNYYESNCNQFVSDADTAIKMKRYNKAIAILSTIPREAKKCYAKIQDKSVVAYTAYQQQRCKENVLDAETRLANNDYSGALYSLKHVDPSSPCAAKAKQLIRQAAVKVDVKEKRDWNFMMKRYNDGVSLEKYRINAMKEIAKAYYKSKPQTVIYKSLF